MSDHEEEGALGRRRGQEDDDGGDGDGDDLEEHGSPARRTKVNK